ncbi:sulfite exporter TauE/SafE family protein [Mycobacteroides abscessus]|uniref:sulfite exporter TauE/SafE family protein n=1 Tax=Mycobacteroides abscessus TaxID=36809 RepID=UPI00192E501D|nr:sulfite exporter TauE/SafE family protein [Mycobacteroides abscessus]MDB2190783.1 sulfite exporter TauE/SafE family protein [Mycobacteroides abscessus subsp. abscessus]MDM2471128.1 sulfite exporter TauE/SafE family protein [Mycobacteroides abscessus]MDM2475878.1 sulfite exporter TauE/SafE family protein [Mycobacteroides abscessus]MDM2481767.1 sulfite exporter TauE/SafE family protein [Mycobacteroides abscessus]MDM2491982.1 sulfite exporter TauE/SafE family protein [Mycobacteroides abscessus
MDAGVVVLLSVVAGLGVSVLTSPVGVSGAVFLLPVQLSVLQVPSPAITPTNLLFNIVAIPGALARYRTQGPLRTPLTAMLLIGTLTGVVIGAILRVFVLSGPQVSRLLVAGFLAPLGIWLCWRPGRSTRAVPGRLLAPPRSTTIALAAIVGVIGGIYGIGGGSLLSPILVGRGVPVATVAPATLVSTFLTSVLGAITYLALAAITAADHIAPHWIVGLSAGAGGLIGGYLGARLQPRLPERVLRTTLGVLAIGAAALYLMQILH